MKRRLLILLGTFFTLQTFVMAGDDHLHDKEHAHDEHAEVEEDGHGREEEESTGGVGPDNAITATNEEKGIQLSPKAIAFIGLRMETYDGKSIPASAFVSYQDNIGVYRLEDGWFKLISPSELRPGDTIVIESVGLLRVAELDAFSEETGHSH